MGISIIYANLQLSIQVPLIDVLFFRTCILSFLICGGLSASIIASPSVVINEVMTSNFSTIADQDGDFEDWIELYNASDESIPLNGFGLSDSYDMPYKWVFPDVTLDPGEFLLIWASGKNRRDPADELHASFRISQAGEEILITDFNGVLLDELPPRIIRTDFSYGRYPDGTDSWYYFKKPTPGHPNTSNPYPGFVEEPVFETPPGFYDGDKTIRIRHNNPAAAIYYTTDGSIPDTLSVLYSDPLTLKSRSEEPDHWSVIRTSPPEGIDHGYGWHPPAEPAGKAHIIRAKAFLPGYLSSETVSGSWFIETEDKDLPVLSLITPEAFFFDSKKGIYVPGAVYDSLGFGDDIWGRYNANYFFRGVDWEREVSLEWFENGELIFGQNLGVRIHGGGSRALPQKSLRLYARNRYGESHIQHNIFPNQPFDSYKRLILRNSGQDFFRNATMFRDAFMQTLVRDLRVTTQAYRPAVLYVNGEYWGIHNVRERYDKYFFDRVFDVSEDQLDLLENRHFVKEGSNEHYIQMISFIEKHGLEKAENYQAVSEMMDVENFIDYMIVNIFFRNTDWPGSNIDFWRYNGTPEETAGKDGLWRWLVYDLDFGFGLNNTGGSWDFDMISHATAENSDHYSNRPWSTFLLRSLLENELFRIQFLQRFDELLNSVFRTDNMQCLIDEMAEVIRTEMPHHINRWGHPGSIEQWESNLELMKLFAKKRPEHQIAHLKDHFETGKRHSLTLLIDNPDCGAISLNSLLIDKTNSSLRYEEYAWKWQGNFFSAVPMELQALPYEDRSFSHWVINEEIISDTHFQINLTSDTHVEAVFNCNNDTTHSEPPESIYKLHLGNNYPNPFNHQTVIPFTLAEESHVTIEIFDILGRHIHTLTNQLLEPGDYQQLFVPNNLSTGLYIYQMKAGGNTFTKKMLFLQ